MKTSAEILQEHTAENGDVDLPEALKAMDAALAVVAEAFTPLDQLNVLEMYVNELGGYLYTTISMIAEAVGVLPEGVAEEQKKFARFTALLKRRLTYDLMVAKVNGANQLITPQ
jgi:hypothetical protein